MKPRGRARHAASARLFNCLADVCALFQARLKRLRAIMLKLANGAPTRHFTIDLRNNELTDLTAEVSPF